jgi:hypothetical protein
MRRFESFLPSQLSPARIDVMASEAPDAGVGSG